MTIDLSVLNPDTRNWAQSTSTASVTLTGTGRTLTGTAAAAYLFGQTLTTVTFDYNADGLQLTDGRFEFPPGSGQPVSLAEVADALRYKYGVDPLIEFAPGLGVRGYSVADINRILETLNREFADDFSLISIDIDDVKGHTTAALPATPASFTVASTATDITTESVTFLNDPDWKSGTPVTVSTTGGGLTAGEDYFVRNLTGGKYEFYTDQTEASGTATTTRVNLTANVATTVLPRTYSPTTATDTTADTVTFVTDPGWTSGTPVRVSTTGGGLTAGVDYFVRNLSGGKYAFYTDQTVASQNGTSGRVNLTADVSETVVPRSYVGIIDMDDGQQGTYGVNGTIQMNPPPGWATGTKVQVSATGGGLTAGEHYFVRHLGDGAYEFYTSQAAASGAVTANRVNLNSNISKTITPSPSSATVSTTDDGNWVTFTDNPKWATGTRVQASTTGGGLTAGVDYFVRALAGGKYALFTDQTAASGTGTAGQVPLTANNVALTLTPSPTSASVDDDWVTFAINPNWVTGTPVQVSSDAGGLSANTVYFVRSLGNGRYDFFTSQGAALGTSSAGVRVNLTGPISAVSPSYSTAALDTLLNTASTPILAAATETELRQSLTEGGDLYTDRFGAFYLNGVRTQAMDVAVTSRLLVQDNVSAEYKTLMDELAERNNLIAAARSVLGGGLNGLQGTTKTLAEQYGMDDVLSELTAGQYSDAQLPYSTVSTNIVDDSVSFQANPGWIAGTPVKVSTSGGGLTQDVVYYVRPDGAGVYSFYNSQAAAQSTMPTGRINLNSSVETVISRAESISLGRSPISVAGSYSTAPGGTFQDAFSFYYQGYDEIAAPGSTWVTGSPIVPTSNIYNDYTSVTNYGSNRTTTPNLVMQANSTYYLRKISNGNYEIFDTLANAQASGTTGKKYFNTSIQGALTLANSHAAQFQPDPIWTDGTAVRVPTTGGGLTAGVDYYVRSHGSGNYSFFTTAAYATATGSPPPTTGRMNLTDPVTLNVKTVAELDRNVIDAADFIAITALLNTLISNKVRDGDLDQAKLQTLTAQLQNNTEAMTALIKAFTDMNAQLARAL